MEYPINEKMSKTIAVFEEELSLMRVGRANPAILNKVMVEYYGTPTPVGQLANIAVPEARMITIQPWETSILGEIEKSILKADIGVTPNNDGKMIRLNFPDLTEERRKELVKELKKTGEESKVSIRSIRRDAIDFYKNKKKENEITEDELKNFENEIQKITDKFVAEIDKKVEAKEKEILTI